MTIISTTDTQTEVNSNITIKGMSEIRILLQEMYLFVMSLVVLVFSSFTIILKITPTIFYEMTKKERDMHLSIKGQLFYIYEINFI